MKGLIKKIVPAILAVAIIATGVFPTEVAAKGKAVTHTVTFCYGTKMVQQQVKHGENAVPPIDTAVPGYAFSAWVGNATNVTEDRIILGAYNKDGYIYNATADSNVVVSKYGLPVFQPQPTVKINTNKTAPTPEWWANLNIPKGVPGQTCAVHFYNGWNGEYWMTKMVPYGGSIPDPGNPCLAGFEFVGWEGDWTNVTEDRCIKAYYFVTHTVTVVARFPDRSDTQIDVQHIRHHEKMRTGNEPWFEGYKFKEYSGANPDDITADCIIYAEYEE